MSWKHELTQQIQSQNKEPLKVSVIGVGHPLFGDDYLGCWVTNQLLEQGISSDNVQVISAESNPENIIGPIVRFQPDHLLLLDAISGKDHGEIMVLPWTEELLLDTYLFSAPLSKFCTFIHRETGCEITLIGVQIEPSGMSLKLTPVIEKTGYQVVDALQSILSIY